MTAGFRLAVARWPAAGVALVPADLPCLFADAVTQVLRLAQGADCAFVPDSATTGTTFVVCPRGRPIVAQYGPNSAAKHLAQGLASLDDAPQQPGMTSMPSATCRRPPPSASASARQRRSPRFHPYGAPASLTA